MRSPRSETNEQVSQVQRWRPVSPGIRKRFRHRKNVFLDRQPKLLILAYHRILPKVSFNPLGTILSTAVFEAQLERLAETYSIVSLKDAMQQQRPKQTEVVLTFDDGYEDCYRITFGILRKKGLLGTFNVAADFIDSGKPLWDWEIMTRLCGSVEMAEIKVGDVRLSKSPAESPLSFASRVIEFLKGADLPTLDHVLEDLRGRSQEVYEPDGHTRCMNSEELQALCRGGMEVGAHGATHRSLSHLPLNEAIDEIVRSKCTIEKHTQRLCMHFAFPFGSKHDYNKALINAVRGAGFQSCLLNVHGYNHLLQRNFALKRIIMGKRTDLRYMFG